jgi:pimeloyl-ACP methyl ester carboxylesterase
MPFTTVGRDNIHYVCPNPIEQGKGKVAVLIHGATDNHKVWNSQIASLAEGHTPIAVDLPGHGESGGSGSTQVSDYTDFLKGFVNALGLTEFVLAGHSMGGSISMDFNLRYPGVTGLILVGAAASWDIPQVSIDLWKTDPQAARARGNEFNFGKNTSKSIIEQHERDAAGINNMVAAGDLEACQVFDIVSEVERIKAPTLIICGDEDFYAVEGSKVLEEKIAGSRMEWLKEIGHDPSIETPETTNRLMGDFLNELD